MMNFRFSWFGAGLIIVGLAMVLHRMDVVRFDWRLVLWALVGLAGALKVVQGFSLRRRGSAFWGTLLLAAGVYFVMEYFGVFEMSPPLFPPVAMLSLGVAFLMMYLVTPKEWHLLVPTAAFVGIGGVMLMAEMGYLVRWEVEEIVRTYWPVALILFGGSLLLSRHSAQ